MMETAIIISVCAIALILFLYLVPIGIWFQALISGVHTSLVQLIFMRFRKVPPTVIVNNMISASKAGLKIQQNDLEAHYLAGGHVASVVNALISADKANMNLDFKTATAIDLAGRDVLKAVQTSVNPKVIDTPPVAAVAKDGIQLIAKARVTVRTNIKQLVGGAGEETILARVGEGIVTSIGSAVSHKQVLENPDSISKLVLTKGLDSGTAFEILSIDIADIDVGKAKAQEARAKVIMAEAEVPLAMAEAFRSGNLGIMDYYRMKNIQADTDMRASLATPAAAAKPNTAKPNEK